jgi:glycosyltransferase involved in cell wall biosynthesis
LTVKKISVIIPVFNAEKYLEKCVQSVIDQMLTDIEIIIVNDGSSDDSLSILKKFAQYDSRVKVISQENKGVSAARNKGLEIASGDWIAFADADDWLECDMLQKMYTAALAENADIVICNVTNICGNGLSERLQLTNEIINFKNNRQEAFTKLMRFKYDYASWNKLYSATVVKQFRLSFSEGLRMYEDLLFNLCFWQYCKKGVVLSDCLYNYRTHPDSVMNQVYSNSTTEYYKLTEAFTSLCATNGWVDTLNNFQKEMRRGFYYRHLPLIIAGVQQQKISLMQKIQLFASELKKLSPVFYNYSKEEMKGLQGVKKNLLKHKQFYLFSIIGVLRNK